MPSPHSDGDILGWSDTGHRTSWHQWLPSHSPRLGRCSSITQSHYTQSSTKQTVSTPIIFGVDSAFLCMGGDGDSDPMIHRMLVMRGCGELKQHLSPLTAPAMSHTHLQRCCGLPRCSPACLSQLGGFPQLTAVGLRCLFAAQPCTQVPTALGKVLGKDPAPPGPSPASLVTALGLVGFGGG